MTIGQRVEYVFKAKGFSTKSFAESFGCTTQYISKIVNGHSDVTMTFIEKLLVIIPDANTDYILTERGEAFIKNETEPYPGFTFKLKETVQQAVAEEMAKYHKTEKLETKKETSKKS